MNALDIARAKELRGDIIERLYGMCGKAVQLSTVRNLLRYKGHCSDDDMLKALQYLSGEGTKYIAIEANDTNYWDSKIILTPAGINLAEGDKQDVGVVIDE